MYVAPTGGKIRKSSNSGQSFAEVGQARDWFSVATSGSGTTAAAVVTSGQIWVTINGGTDWVPRENTRAWYAIAVDSSGSNMVAAENNGLIYRSSDAGVNWASISSGARNWFALAMTSDSSMIFACEIDGNVWYTSNAGVTWNALTGASGVWHAVAINSDGSKVLVASYGGYLYLSTALGSLTPTAYAANWFSVAMSPNGQLMAAVTFGGYLHICTDGLGNVWSKRDVPRDWHSVAISRSTALLTAVDNGGYIYTAQLSDPSSFADPVVFSSYGCPNIVTNDLYTGAMVAQRFRTSSSGGHISRLEVPLDSVPAFAWEVYIASASNQEPDVGEAELVYTVPANPTLSPGSLLRIDLGFPVSANQDIWIVIRPTEGNLGSSIPFYYSSAGCGSITTGDAWTQQPPPYTNTWDSTNGYKLIMRVYENNIPW
jgi:hypothetical protein